MNYKSIINDFKKGGFEIITNNVIDNKTLNSFFYDGEVLSFKNDRYIVSIQAVGDIRIENKKREVVYHNHKNYDDLLNVKNDKELSKIKEPNFIWENNNWFELLILDTKFDDYIDDMGEVFYELNELNLEWVKEIISDYEKED